VSVVASGPAGSAYSRAVLAGSPVGYWRLGEASGNAINQAGTDDMVVASGVRRPAPGAVAGDQDTAATFTGTSTSTASSQVRAPAPNVFSVETWFRTSASGGGKILGYGSATTGLSDHYDRHVYLDANGRLVFGVWPQVNRTLETSRSYNDGRWHQVVATLGPAGMAFYVDGQLVGSRADTTSGQAYDGYWRIGGDRTWSGAQFFTGDIDDLSIHRTVLSASQVADRYRLASAPVANVAPTAAFTSTVSGLTAALDGRGSTDSDGTVRSHAWNFGDGTTGSGATTSHAYTAAGTYPVTLTVTDDAGATATVERSVTVTQPAANKAPTAAFSAVSNGLTVALDGSGSADSDGTIRSHVWTFGDGTSGTGVSTSHAYAAAGDYRVQLTVTDDDGATAVSDQTVTITAPAGPQPLARDLFQRTVTGSLGTADVGGAWTVSNGTPRQSVNAGVATLDLPAAGNLTGSYLGQVSQTSADLLTSFSLSAPPTGGGVNVSLTGRRVGANLEYRARLRFLANGSVALAFTRLAGTSADALIGAEMVVPGLSYTPGTTLQVRVEVTGTGTTQLAATVWTAGSPEPASPTLTRTDTTASLQAAGGVGVLAYLSGSATAGTAVRFTTFEVRPGA
jgi:PKD repeat protein